MALSEQEVSLLNSLAQHAQSSPSVQMHCKRVIGAASDNSVARAPSWLAIIRALVNLDVDAPLKRAVYQLFFKLFPSAAFIYAQYVDFELKAENIAAAEQVFNTVLLKTPHVPLWTRYLMYIQRKHTVETEAGRKQIVDAFEFSLQIVGLDWASGPIWRQYVSFLHSIPTSDPYAENNKLGAIRRVYQRAVVSPMEDLEAIRGEYLAFENQRDRNLASQLLQQSATEYTNARAAYRERKKYTRGVSREQLAVHPSPEKSNVELVVAWKRLISYEKSNPEQAEAARLVQRLRFTFESALLVLYLHPDIWIDYARTLFACLNAFANNTQPAIDATKQVYKRAIEALPSSCIVQFSYSTFLESHSMAPEARGVMDSMMLSDFFTEKQKHLILINQLLLIRRSLGVDAARKQSVKSFKSKYCSWQLYVAAAHIELYCNKAPTPARKVFEFGLRQFPHHMPFLLQYISLLYTLNEENNMRVFFDKLVSQPELASSKEIWDEYFRFEITFGDRASIDKCSARREAALGGADPNGIFGQIMRFKFRDLLPAEENQIRSMQNGIGISISSKTLKQDTFGEVDPLRNYIRVVPGAESFAAPDSAKDKGLVLFSREMAESAPVGGGLPKEIVQLMQILPPANSYDGPLVDVDEFITLLRVAKPQAPMQERSRPRVGRVVVQNAPPSSDLYRSRRQNK